LVAAFKKRVFATCLSFIPNKEDAEDLAQEVFLEVFESVKHFKEEAQLSTWIYRISVNKCLEELRKRKQLKRAAYFKSLIGLNPLHENISAEKMNHPGFIAENKEKALELYAAIEKLPENQKIAFTLTQIDGMSYDESAAIMGTTNGAIESLVYRARINLKKRLGHFKK